MPSYHWRAAEFNAIKGLDHNPTPLSKQRKDLSGIELIRNRWIGSNIKQIGLEDKVARVKLSSYEKHYITLIAEVESV